MTTNQIIEAIQLACDEFIRNNQSDVEDAITENQVEISGSFKSHAVTGITNKTWGVYVFYMKALKDVNELDDLKAIWENDLAGNKLRSAQVIKKRFHPIVTGQTYCLYVGKSEELAHRVSQHIDQTTSSSTYGLKLSEHDAIHPYGEFSYSYFVLGEDLTEDLDAWKCLLVTLEKHLRSELVPLIGRQ